MAPAGSIARSGSPCPAIFHRVPRFCSSGPRGASTIRRRSTKSLHFSQRSRERRRAPLRLWMTVIQGTRVSEFSVKVLGVLRNAGPAGDLVLFRASGPSIEPAGGLAAGMSGSPIYIGGQMAGAFSYSLQFADPMIGLFTPIEDMLRDIPARAVRPHAGVYAVPPFDLGGRTIRRILLGASR